MILAAQLLCNRQSKIRNRQSHWLAFVDKQTDVTAVFGKRQDAAQRLQSTLTVALCLHDERLQDPDLDLFLNPASLRRGSPKTTQQRQGLVQPRPRRICGASRNEHSRQIDVVQIIVVA
jgi:hypothetical protein